MYTENYIPKKENMSSKLYTHTEIQLSDILHKIWENKISINNEDLNKLYEFTIKKYDNE